MGAMAGPVIVGPFEGPDEQQAIYADATAMANEFNTARDQLLAYGDVHIDRVGSKSSVEQVGLFASIGFLKELNELRRKETRDVGIASVYYAVTAFEPAFTASMSRFLEGAQDIDFYDQPVPIGDKLLVLGLEQDEDLRDVVQGILGMDVPDSEMTRLESSGLIVVENGVPSLTYYGRMQGAKRLFEYSERDKTTPIDYAERVACAAIGRVLKHYATTGVAKEAVQHLHDTALADQEQTDRVRGARHVIQGVTNAVLNPDEDIEDMDLCGPCKREACGNGEGIPYCVVIGDALAGAGSRSVGNAIIIASEFYASNLITGDREMTDYEIGINTAFKYIGEGLALG